MDTPIKLRTNQPEAGLPIKVENEIKPGIIDRYVESSLESVAHMAALGETLLGGSTTLSPHDIYNAASQQIMSNPDETEAAEDLKRLQTYFQGVFGSPEKNEAVLRNCRQLGNFVTNPEIIGSTRLAARKAVNSFLVNFTLPNVAWGAAQIAAFMKGPEDLLASSLGSVTVPYITRFITFSVIQGLRDARHIAQRDSRSTSEVYFKDLALQSLLAVPDGGYFAAAALTFFRYMEQMPKVDSSDKQALKTLISSLRPLSNLLDKYGVAEQTYLNPQYRANLLQIEAGEQRELRTQLLSALQGAGVEYNSAGALKLGLSQRSNPKGMAGKTVTFPNNSPLERTRQAMVRSNYEGRYHYEPNDAHAGYQIPIMFFGDDGKPIGSIRLVLPTSKNYRIPGIRSLNLKPGQKKFREGTFDVGDELSGLVMRGELPITAFSQTSMQGLKAECGCDALIEISNLAVADSSLATQSHLISEIFILMENVATHMRDQHGKTLGVVVSTTPEVKVGLQRNARAHGGVCLREIGKISYEADNDLNPDPRAVVYPMLMRLKEEESFV